VKTVFLMRTPWFVLTAADQQDNQQTRASCKVRR